MAAVLLLAAVGRADSPPADVQVREAPPAIADAAVVSEYWLGIQCRPADDALRSHLRLAPSRGLVAEDVAPESPAARDGIRQYDVVTSVAGKPVGEIKDLLEAVEASRGKELSLELIRSGESKQVTVKPEKRPKELRPAPRVPHLTGDAEIIRKWLEELQPGSSVRFRFYHRGSILPADAPSHPPLPKNVTITVTKRADEPAKVTVKQDSETWEVTEHELGKLPEDLRPYAEQMLGRIFPAGTDPIHLFDFGPHLDGSDRGEPGATPDANSATAKHLEAMSRELEQLRQAMERLQKQQAPKKK